MTFNVSQSGLTPVFDVLQADTDDVIGFINFIIERGETTPKTPNFGKTKMNGKMSKPKKGKDIWQYI